MPELECLKSIWNFTTVVHHLIFQEKISCRHTARLLYLQCAVALLTMGIK